MITSSVMCFMKDVSCSVVVIEAPMVIGRTNTPDILVVTLLVSKHMYQDALTAINYSRVYKIEYLVWLYWLSWLHMRS